MPFPSSKSFGWNTCSFSAMTLLTTCLFVPFFIVCSRAQVVSGSSEAYHAAPVSTTGVNTAQGDDTDYKKMLQDIVSRGLASMPASFTRQLLAADARPECSIALLRTMRAVKNLDPWAIRLLDATGKYPTGVFQASRVDMGAFDECLETEVRDSSGELQSRGQYCNLEVIPNSTITKRVFDSVSEVVHKRFVDLKDALLSSETAIIRIGICFLNDCGEQDLQALIDSVLPPVVKARVSNCVTAEPEPWTRAQMGFVVFFSLLVTVVIAATLVDLYMKPEHRSKGGISLKYLTAFSAIANTNALFQGDNKSSPDRYSLQFMHGIRFFAVAHIVIGHCYEAVSDSWGRLLNMFIASGSWTNMPLGSAFNSVDTFFFMSGFFLCLVVAKQKATGPIVFLFAVIRRLIRICIPLFFIIMCIYALQPFVAGPNVKAFFLKFNDEIATNWWRLILQIRNFSIFNDETLLIHLWYLSADYQLFLVSLLVLLSLKRKLAWAASVGHWLEAARIWNATKKLAMRKTLLLGAFAVLSLLGCVIATWTASDPEVLPFMTFPGFSKRSALKTLNLYYIKPFYHAVCFFSGCVTLLLMEKFKDRKISMRVRFAGWCVAVSCALCAAFMPFPWYSRPDPAPAAAKLFAAFSQRVLWSIFLVWVTLVCSTGRGGVFGRFLSWNVFVPLSKLSFGVYLIHYPFIQLMLHASRERLFWSHFTQVTLFFGVLAWSLLLAYIAFLMCEGPTATLDKLAFQRLTRRRKATELGRASRPNAQGGVKQESVENGHAQNLAERL